MFLEINYNEISKYYRDIIGYILNNLSYVGLKYNDDIIHTNHTREEYEEEYLNAYGYLQRAKWRLNEVDDMKDFYNEPDFFYFGMNNLSSARHRIQHYLENTTWTIFDDLQYQEHDDCVMDYYQPIRLGHEGFEEYYKESHEKYEYYWNLHSAVQLKQLLKEDCNRIIQGLTIFLEYLDNTDYDVLMDGKSVLEDLDEKALDFLYEIPIINLS